MDEFREVGQIDIIAYNGHIDDGAFDAAGPVAGEVYGVYFTEFGHHIVDDVVDAYVVADHGLNGRKEGVFDIDPVHFLIAFMGGVEQTGFFEAVEFDANGVGTFAKFTFQSTQITPA